MSPFVLTTPLPRAAPSPSPTGFGFGASSNANASTFAGAFNNTFGGGYNAFGYQASGGTTLDAEAQRLLDTASRCAEPYLTPI